jgi:hypothetical protein
MAVLPGTGEVGADTGGVDGDVPVRSGTVKVPFVPRSCHVVPSLTQDQYVYVPGASVLDFVRVVPVRRIVTAVLNGKSTLWPAEFRAQTPAKDAVTEG